MLLILLPIAFIFLKTGKKSGGWAIREVIDRDGIIIKNNSHLFDLNAGKLKGGFK
jgi:hypothetical protein